MFQIESGSAGRLLLSDQRTGRWVLLGAEHIAEARRRLAQLAPASRTVSRIKPPTWTIKGVTVHLQSAFKLADALERFAASGDVMTFAEQSPGFELAVEQTKEGMALRDFDRKFRPTSNRVRQRWERLDLAQRRGVYLPPIDVYRVGDLHFVMDGHHRVSVAVATGQKTIEARVT